MSTDDTRPDLSVPLDERAAAPAPPAGEVYARHLAAAAEAADAAYRLAAARVVVYEFLHQYGRSDLPAFRVELDLAGSLRKVIDNLGDEEERGPTIAVAAPAVTAPAPAPAGRPATAAGPAAASSEQLQVAISSAIEKAWWSPGTPASAKVMEIVGPLLERAEAAESERDRFREQARILGDERSEWACDRCNVIHPWRDGDRFTAACPDCGALMLPTSLSSRLLANARARAEAAEAKLAEVRSVLLEGGQGDATARCRAIAITGTGEESERG